MRFILVTTIYLLSSILTGHGSAEHFVLDPLKPYAFLTFDHIGPRRPIVVGEGSTGLWLRIVNNCRVPILVPSSGPTEGKMGLMVFDEIVEYKYVPSISDTTGPALNAPWTSGKGEFHESHASATDRQESPPYGYSEETYSLTRIDPGKELLFSVPLNHVSDHWFMRIEVYLDVSAPKAGSGPPTILDFSKGQIPDGVWPEPSGGQRSPEGDAVHESGHVHLKQRD